MGWAEFPLSELTVEDTPITYGVVKPGPEDSKGVLFIRGGDIADGRILTDQLRTITREVSEQYRRTLLKGGEIVVSLVGNPGQVAVVPSSLAGANIARQVGLVRLRDDVDARFVKYFLGSTQGQAALGAHSSGSVQQVINLRDLKTVRVPCPLIAEQHSVAQILGALDDKIELNRRMCQTLEATVRTIFKSWFIDFDPVHDKMQGRGVGLLPHLAELFPDCMEDSEVGSIPVGWKVKSLDAIADFLNGLALQRFPPVGGTYLPVIKIAQLRSGDTTGADKASSSIPPEYIVHDGDVIFSWSGSLECVVWSGGPGALNQHLFKVTSPAYPKWFYFSWIYHHLADFRHIAAGKATTMGHIQRHHLTDAKVLVPDNPLMEASDTFLAPVFNRMLESSLQSRTLRLMRDALLPKLFSGELRVNHAEKFDG